MVQRLPPACSRLAEPADLTVGTGLALDIYHKGSRQDGLNEREHKMVRRVFSLTLQVEKGLTVDEVAGWFEDRLNKVVNYHLFKAVAVTPCATHDVLYAQLSILHYTSINEAKIEACLADPPLAIRVVATKRLVHGDNVAVLTLRPVVLATPAPRSPDRQRPPEVTAES